MVLEHVKEYLENNDNLFVRILNENELFARIKNQYDYKGQLMSEEIIDKYIIDGDFLVGENALEVVYFDWDYGIKLRLKEGTYLNEVDITSCEKILKKFKEKYKKKNIFLKKLEGIIDELFLLSGNEIDIKQEQADMIEAFIYEEAYEFKFKKEEFPSINFVIKVDYCDIDDMVYLMKYKKSRNEEKLHDILREMRIRILDAKLQY